VESPQQLTRPFHGRLNAVTRRAIHDARMPEVLAHQDVRMCAERVLQLKGEQILVAASQLVQAPSDPCQEFKRNRKIG
jgi:hypothetical protein